MSFMYKKTTDKNTRNLLVNIPLNIHVITTLNLLVPVALINGGARRLPAVPQMQPLRETTTHMRTILQISSCRSMKCFLLRDKRVK